MLNQVVIVGRLVDNPTTIEKDDNKKTYMTLAVPRAYKNADGVYETDFIDCVLWNGISTTVCEYCHKGDLVGIKARLQTTVVDEEDGTKRKVTEVIVEKVSFLSSKKNTEES